ncbi:turripeptide OL11-like [Penaeus japonicus]|uniref:turripeptide OL11-like n=1 Tax=Penaeus japonicus TaxID=27405 RepID=UPI001C70FC92|nr:turripeptide OL11-like [Penaeus japonicus]
MFGQKRNGQFAVILVLLIATCTVNVCNGACEKTCNMYYKPVCGSDFKTYKNMCHLRNRQACYDPKLYSMFAGDCLRFSRQQKQT